MKISYPKVLIIGETFRYNGGGGITLINLFKDWNPECVAVVTEKINETSFLNGYEKFYQLGNMEIRIPFPFNFINKIQTSGDFHVKEPSNTTQLSLSSNSSKSSLQKLKYLFEIIYYRILIFLGLYNSSYRIVVSDKLLKWIDEYSPDIIYAQPFKFCDMIFARELKEKTGIPLAIHIMDDSVNILNKPNLLYACWKNKIKNAFDNLVERTDICLSISESMSEEYLKRYNRSFIPFRNPVEISSWKPFIKKNWTLNDEVNIVYTGRLAVPNINSLLTYCQVIDELNTIGYRINLHIYSIDTNSSFLAKIKKFKSVYIHKAVKFGQIPALITQFDFAFLPIDFTPKGFKYAQFSVSTKTSEYMISGVPILLFAPGNIALTEYARKNKCMYIVSENDKDRLSEAMIKLIKDLNLRTTLAKRAFEVAKSDSDATMVRKKFREVLNRSVIITDRSEFNKNNSIK